MHAFDSYSTHSMYWTLPCFLHKFGITIFFSLILHDYLRFYSSVFILFQTNTESRCIINKSPQQLIFDIHTSLRVVQLKAEILFEFSYMILHLYGKGNLDWTIRFTRSLGHLRHYFSLQR